MEKNQETIVNYLKKHGFVYQNSEIYNGLSNAWDYGPLGAILKNNLKQLLIKHFVFSEPNMTFLDSSIILNANVWKASGHLDNFSDPLIDCKNCKNRFRVDKLCEEQKKIIISENLNNDLLDKIVLENGIHCPICKKKDWTNVRKFNLMFKTFQGVTEDSLNTLYLRPETAQGIFINFKNILRTQRMKIPFGVGQIGKVFRNEITPGNFIFRTREFEQMEIEYFTTQTNALNDFEFFKNKIYLFLTEILKIKKENLRIYNHNKDQLSHYSKKTIDFEFNFPHGFGELWGLAHRGTYDLNAHENLSKKNLKYQDPLSNDQFIPDVIEPSVGIERLLYALICNSYSIEDINNNSNNNSDDDKREVLKIPFCLSPYTVAVFPLVKKLDSFAENIYLKLLKNGFFAFFDKSGSIGKRYRRMDAIGTPFCVTIDFDTEKKQLITIRHRDTMKQEQIGIDNLITFLKNKLETNS
ncbi:glycine--tRNA ligase [Mycoplasmoides alvi]|uniref:glycine--tRNA ligase n=1 Tax=Mycoplasmoides alvi TaxID=78580 RepID=UPI00051B14CF|nr:glycine--tRNA ligase [Mycoplasmoides alvi]